MQVGVKGLGTFPGEPCNPEIHTGVCKILGIYYKGVLLFGGLYVRVPNCRKLLHGGSEIPVSNPSPVARQKAPRGSLLEVLAQSWLGS